ncbi:nucleotidyltransferase domain-containing protein [Pseudoneobacillus rhizosphaerae]|jgi:hypothetical protein|uniref:Aminoglycoside adenylyltransferase n=1 Tax=Pseudoneobacillus rhizosphaerae TaxID=2880968 RepID=A0A9C7GCT8_9BACI|nr:hypothetical protein [Pseudoneobacillus rhizosphaerae]CAG9609943.1 hypothetical protein NEOCIP111885_03686 [Pseudoneobacillus rhizosphaerae]
MQNKSMDQTFENTQSQLNMLREINDICTSLGATIWLRGGWAIDFLLGRVTRSHSDLDLVSMIQHRNELENALVNAGFQQIPVTEFQTDFLKDGVDISFVFVERSNEGRIFAYSIPDWEWRTDSLQSQKYQLQGVSANVLNPQMLLEEKLVYEEGTGRKPRPKDIESIKILQGIINHVNG